MWRRSIPGAHGPTRRPPRSVLGLELDANAVARMRARGFSAVHARVEECEVIQKGTLDLATMFHVIEHVADPRTEVRRVAEWLVPGGLLALETPNVDSWDARRWANGLWGGYHIPRHWHLFSPETLSELVRSIGLEPVALSFKTGHSFWLWSFHHVARYGIPPRPRFSKHLSPLGGFLPLLAAVTLWDVLRSAAGYRTSAMLLIARKSA